VTPHARALGGAVLAAAGLLPLLAASAAPAGSPADFLAPRGRFLNVDGHRLHLACSGQGGPTVIFEAGVGGSADDWLELQERLAGTQRSCAYDRAGYGWSDPGPLPRSSSQIVAELRALLAAAGERLPVVLVGHSFGGLVVQELAARHPGEVAGVVLVESSHPEQEQRLGPLVSGGPGAIRNPVHMPARPASPGCRDTGPQNRFLNSRRKAIFAQMQELESFAASAALVADMRYPPGVPTVVLSRGRRAAPAGTAGDRREAAWTALQRDLARRTGALYHRIGEHSGHNLHLCEPRLVARAVVAVSRAHRQAREPAGVPR